MNGDSSSVRVCVRRCSHSAGEEGRPYRWTDTVVESLSDVPQHHACLADSCEHRILLIHLEPLYFLSRIFGVNDLYFKSSVIQMLDNCLMFEMLLRK